MIDPKYVICPTCRCVTRLFADEEERCAYCGLDIQGGKEVSERQWRKYWIGVLGQYKSLNIVKKTKQLDLEGIRNFSRELIKERGTSIKWIQKRKRP